MPNSAPRPITFFTPFAISHYRFQWIADLLLSCAMEMEVPILGWYILVETKSVMMLVLFGGAQYIGTLLSPLMGVAGDRLGCRNLLFIVRSALTLLAVCILGLNLLESLTPVAALILSGLAGLLRPSDGMIRNTLVSQTVPPQLLMSAMGVSRTTQDMARVMGALLGTGLVTWVGFHRAYETISVLYVGGTLLTLGAHQVIRQATARSPLHDMWLGLVYVFKSPTLLAAFWIAFLINLTAYPFTLGLLPHVAKSIYGIDQTGLGTLVASFSLGGLLGSLCLSLWGQKIQPGRAMILGSAFWYVFLVLFGQTESLAAGFVLLCCAGFAQNICTVPMFVLMLRLSDEDYRGRVMGARMLAIYGLPLGLLAAGPMIEQFGFVITNIVMTLAGLAVLGLITLVWRKKIWDLAAEANQR